MILLLACSDQGLHGKDETPAFDSGGDFVPTGATTGGSGAEVCDGVDNDGDGEVDEGFADADANGRVDCLDSECPPLDLPAAGEVEIDHRCDPALPEVPDPWAVRVKWSFVSPSAESTCLGSYSMPAVGQLDDDDGDGDITEADSPDVVIGMQCGRIVALDGATGAEKWSVDVGGWPHVHIADVDADGRPDIATADATKHAMLLDGADGSTRWTATELAAALYYVFPVAADLDEDGEPELVDDDNILDGQDGSLVATMDLDATGTPYRMSAVADVDLDGDQEIALAGHLFDSDGSELWDAGLAGSFGFWPYFVQADEDDEAEVGFLGHELSLFDHDGTERFSLSYETVTQPGPPCVGDFDGDGASEIAFASYNQFFVYELDGSRLWAEGIYDPSGISACSGFDLDGDGALEILYADMTAFRIFDGATGLTRYIDETHTSSTAMEYPTVADLDGDGHAEILVVHNYGATETLTVYENDGEGWTPGGPVWPSHQFTMVDLEADGTVPQEPAFGWLDQNVFRARLASDAPSPPDLLVAITDVCVADCAYGPVAVGLQVANQGSADAEAGAILALYADDEAGERLVWSTELPAIAAGTALEAYEVELGVAELGAFGWVARVEGAEAQCDEDNDEDRWADSPC